MIDDKIFIEYLGSDHPGCVEVSVRIGQPAEKIIIIKSFVVYAEIGKESKNQLDHDSRFESVTQKSDS